jgi:hypothetical protein
MNKSSMKLDSLNLVFSGNGTEKLFNDLMDLLVGWQAIYDSSTKIKREAIDIVAFYTWLKIITDCLYRELNELDERVTRKQLEDIFDTLNNIISQNRSKGIFPESVGNFVMYGIEGQLDGLRKKHEIY